jgi:hypothetical protein
LAQFLDPHLLNYVLKLNVPNESAQVRNQLKLKFLSANEQEASLKEQEALSKAQKLLTLL